MNRLEHKLIDRLINKKLLNKRQLGLPLKYNYDSPRYGNSRFTDRLFFPKNNLDRLIGNIYERILPGFKFFFWNEKVRWARENGYTLSEILVHNFRHANEITRHSIAQMMHPYGMLNAQKRDMMIRRMNTLLPGYEVPDWAQETRRYVDVDYHSFMAPEFATWESQRESTPAPHYGTSAFTAVGNLFEMRWMFGYPAQRLFYNEDIRGDFYRNGYHNEAEKAIIHGWYADAQRDSHTQRIAALKDKEYEEFKRNFERWDSLCKEFFPEVANTMKINKVHHKFEEAYYERNMNDIRGAVFRSKWLSALQNKRFSDEEISEIYRFFLGNDNLAFFDISETEDISAKDVYKKFVSEMDFPDLLSLDRGTVYPPEKQFYDKLDEKWGINFETVDTYRSLYLQMIKNENHDSEVNSLVLEEVYNPIYRLKLRGELGYDLKQTESFVLKAIKSNVSLEKLKNIAEDVEKETVLVSTASLSNMVNKQLRDIVKKL